MIKDLISDYKSKIDLRLNMIMTKSGNRYDNVIEAANYSLTNGGKRIRPILLLEFYKLCGGDDDSALNCACALEMIHTYSLIHDDLPMMDNDDLRRGKPSCHKTYGEQLALLAGDGLLTDAFGVAAKTFGLPFERVARAVEILSSCAGIDGMVGGQVIDVLGEGKELDIDSVFDMYRLKTGALIRAAATCGAVLAGADEEHIGFAGEYADKLGIAFQLIDDILDTVGDQKLLGKPVGSDEKNQKNTAVNILGVDKCREMAKDLTTDALEILNRFDGDTSNIKELTEYLLVREY